MVEENQNKRNLGIGLLLIAAVNGLIALFGIVKREHNAPVTWGELIIVLVIQAALATALAIKIFYFTYFNSLWG